MERQKEDHESAFKHQTAYEKLKIGTWALVALVLYIILATAFPLPAGPNIAPVFGWEFIPPNSFFVEARTAIGGALISFCAFGAFMELLNYKSMDQEVGRALTRVFGSSTALIKKFNSAEKREFVENTLESLLGESIGTSTYDYVKPMLQEGAVFKTNFEYNVYIKDNPPEKIPETILEHFPNTKYRWIREAITYKLMRPTIREGSQYSTGPFHILFLFDKTSLELLNPDQSIFARFLIELEPEQLEWLFEQDDKTATEIFSTLVQPEFWEKFDNSNNDKRIEITTKIDGPTYDSKGRTKKYFKVAMQEPLSAAAGESCLRVGFSYPYRRSSTHFIFTIPQPVYSPTLTFNYNHASITDVDYSSYYSIADPTKSDTKPPEDDHEVYEFRVNGCWVFPTSGITMVWKNES